MKKDHTYSLFFDVNKLTAFRRYPNSQGPGRFYEAEVFEYDNDIRYSRIVSCAVGKVNNGGFTYYRYQDGHVIEVLRVAGGFGGVENGVDDCFGLHMPSIQNVFYTAFDSSDPGVPVIRKKLELGFDSSTGKYRIKHDYDMLDPAPPKPEKKQVVDTQKKLCKTLKKKIKNSTTLDQIIDGFFDVVSQAKPNDEEMLLYEVGYFSHGNDKDLCSFCLIRQTPARQDEFYQMHLELLFDTGNEEHTLHEYEWREPEDGDLREYILQSKAYESLKDKNIYKINVWVDET
jgi:hypothetical protein